MTDLTAVNLWTARLWALTTDTELSRFHTPTNLAQIREAVLGPAAGRALTVTPNYHEVPADHIQQLAGMAEKLAEADGPLLELVRQALDSTLGLARALSDRSPDAITAHGRAEYGAPTVDLVADAEQVLVQPEPTPGPAGPGLDAPAIAQLVRRVLDRLQVEGWTAVVLDHMSARMAVASGAREVRIRADATVTGPQLRGLLVHEVGTHVLRADEGARQPLHLLARGLPGYLEAEEGLATHHEAKVDPRPARTRTFALRVLAAETALAGGLAEVMERLTAHTSPAKAFPIALRAKRGMADLTAPGSPLKDVVYLRGLRSVGEHLRSHPDDHSLLMAGKLGLQHLGLARRLHDEDLLTLPGPRVQQLIDEARMDDPPWLD